MGRRFGCTALAATALLVAASCGNGSSDASNQAPASTTPSVAMPSYPPAPAQDPANLVAADFSQLKDGCDHPCSAPIHLQPGNKSRVLVRSWPCEYYEPTGQGVCVDADKAKAGVRDLASPSCLAQGNEDRNDGNLSDDRGIPNRDWVQVIIPAKIAAQIADPRPSLASDGTYRGYISTLWLRKASDPRGTRSPDVTAPNC